MRRVITNPSIEDRLFRLIETVSTETVRLSFCRSLALLRCLARRIDEFEQNQCVLFDSDRCQEILERQERTEQQLSDVIRARETDVTALHERTLRPYSTHRSSTHQNPCRHALFRTSFEQLDPYLTHRAEIVRRYASQLLEQQQRLSNNVAGEP